MMIIYPYEQWLADYTISTALDSFWTNYVNVVVPSSAVGLVLLDNVAIPAASFTQIASTPYKYVQIQVSGAGGSHRLIGPKPFGVFAYGYGNAAIAQGLQSYSYPGGMGVAP